MSTPGNPSYSRRAALVLGILQVICGVANICIQIPMYVEDLYILGPASVGVWTGVFFLITGILALVSVKASTNCMIIAVMVMCIITSLVAALGIILASIFFILSTLTGNDYDGDTEYKYKIAIDVTIAHCVICLIYGICSIVLSAFCCRAVCCGPRQNMQVVYISTDASSGQQQTAYVYAAPGASAPAPQPTYPTAQHAYQPGLVGYPPTEGGQPALYPSLEPSAPPDAPPAYTEKEQIY